MSRMRALVDRFCTAQLPACCGVLVCRQEASVLVTDALSQQTAYKLELAQLPPDNPFAALGSPPLTRSARVPHMHRGLDVATSSARALTRAESAE